MIWSVTHNEVYPSASAARAKSARVFPAAYSHLCGSITPNCIVPPPLDPCAGVVACMMTQADVGAEVRELGDDRTSAWCHQRDARLLGKPLAA